MSTHTTAVVPLSAVVSAAVRAECARRGWTQQQLAERLGVGRETISDRHRGRTPWTLDEVDRVAQIMGLEVGDLLARPKGFEPLTFWLGADHTLTLWHAANGGSSVLFCDECGLGEVDVFPSYVRAAEAHGLIGHGVYPQLVERAA